MANNSITCPFCNSISGSEYTIQLHIEEFHTDDSPFIADAVASGSTSRTASRPSSSESSGMDSMWVKCTRPGCGELVHLSGIDEHIDLHLAEALQEEENGLVPPPLPTRQSPRQNPHAMGHGLSVRSAPETRQQKSHSRDTSTRSSPGRARKTREPDVRLRDSIRSNSSILSYLSGSSSAARSTISKLAEPRNPGRLGKRELGPHAFEKEMPAQVRRRLIHGAEPQQINKIGRDGKVRRETVVENETTDLIPVLADVAALDSGTTATYLCHPSTKHIHKLECDGNFCGYWNIQVLMTYVQHMRPDGPQVVPHVIQIQDIIEQAWKNGTCAYGKIETGGIMNTRKWIGTNEALAFFTQMGVQVEALTFKTSEEYSDRLAVEGLLDYVEAYFMSGEDTAKVHGTSYITQLAPIYFQRVGHSMTIVGIERKKDGSRNLLIFDSTYKTSNPIRALVRGQRTQSSPDALLRAYRRSDTSLATWDEFEILIPQSLANR